MKYNKRPFNIYEYLKELSRLSKGASQTDEEMKQICQEFERNVDSSKEEKEKLRQVFIKCNEDAKADQARQKRKTKKKQAESVVQRLT